MVSIQTDLIEHYQRKYVKAILQKDTETMDICLSVLLVLSRTHHAAALKVKDRYSGK